MKITERTIKFLGKTLCGDNGLLPYKSGPKLVDFFVDLGADDQYGEGFPSKWKYTEEKVREFNDSQTLKKIIENSVDPRDFLDGDINADDSIVAINEYLKFNGFELRKVGEFYRIHDSKGLIVEAQRVNELSHDFIKEQIQKCHQKIETGDYNGAITNSRSLAEAVMIVIIETAEGKEIKNDGKLDNLYKQVKKILNLTFDPKVLPPTVIQILSGLDSISSGLTGLSNNSGDRHANKFKTQKHHARLSVNATMTLVDFLLDSRDYQKLKVDGSKGLLEKI